MVRLAVATAVLDALIWVWWKVDPGAPQGLLVPAALTALLGLNLVLTGSGRGHEVKRWLVARLQRYVLNPPIKLLLRIGFMPFGYALLETTGRVSGKARCNPVGNGRIGTTFWIIAEHGDQAGYVRNIVHNPRVRVRMRDGLRFVWFTGTASVLPDDDPYARQKALSRWHPMRALNAMVVRVMGTELLTIRIELDPAPAGSEVTPLAIVA